MCKCYKCSYTNTTRSNDVLQNANQINEVKNESVKRSVLHMSVRSYTVWLQ